MSRMAPWRQCLQSTTAPQTPLAVCRGLRPLLCANKLTMTALHPKPAKDKTMPVTDCAYIHSRACILPAGTYRRPGCSRRFSQQACHIWGRAWCWRPASCWSRCHPESSVSTSSTCVHAAMLEKVWRMYKEPCHIRPTAPSSALCTRTALQTWGLGTRTPELCR